MMLVDTNVLIYAHRRDAQRHPEYRDWVRAMINGSEPYAVSDFARDRHGPRGHRP